VSKAAGEHQFPPQTLAERPGRINLLLAVPGGRGSTRLHPPKPTPTMTRTQPSQQGQKIRSKPQNLTLSGEMQWNQ